VLESRVRSLERLRSRIESLEQRLQSIRVPGL
jgi:hypothetical protein